MRWKYLGKLFLKSALLLVFLTILAFSILDGDNKDLINADISPQFAPGNQSNLQKIESSSINDDNGPYYNANDVEDLEEDLNSVHAKNVRYHLRFWDLINSTKSQDHVLSTEPLFKDGSPLDYLWRPNVSVQDLNAESYSLVPQIVWEMEAPNTSYAKNFTTKTIVLWDGFHWWSKDAWSDPKPLISTDCEIAPNSLTQCHFTQSKDDLGAVHAVIAARDAFHMGGVNVPEHVLKFYFMLESPFHSSAALERDQDLIASYWRGSDVVTPYAKWVSYDLKKKATKQEKNYASGKTKTAAAFISNCDAWNNRVDYIKELRKYIKVDIYGGCGELSCSRFGTEDCFGMLKKDYYFYMSFENSNCRDYVTEKLYTNGLSNDILPIVMGAHPDDYSALAPYKSYLHVEEFDSPKELGAYLNYLIANPAEYNSYFEWNGTGEFVSAAFFCQICAMVHYADLVPPPRREKAFHWGTVGAVEDGMCLPKGRWYWSRDNEGQKLGKTGKGNGSQVMFYGE